MADIKDKALEIINKHPSGIRFKALKTQVLAALPSANPQTVGSVISQLEDGKDCSRPARGVYAPLTSHTLPTSPLSGHEEKIYEPFAKFLVEDLGECIWAIPMGGKISNSKWSTPDVIGVWRSPWNGFLKVLELTSVEIKATEDSNDLIIGFGQACAYKLFSHKSYLVIPGDGPKEEDKSRIEDLCVLYGIGLILFYRENNDEYRFEIRNRASKAEPDLHYIELFLSSLPQEYRSQLGLI